MWISPDFNLYQSKVYTILPFEDRNAEKYKADYSDAADVVRDAFETAFLKTKNRIVERKKLQSLISEKKFALTGLTQEQGIEIGKMLNTDIVVFGTIKSYYKGSILGSYTTVGFSVRAVKVSTGEIVWKGSHTKSTSWDYAYEPAAFADEVADELVQELISKGDI
jgi:curli biogenesis system outer membrane secretion channel CsgG